MRIALASDHAGFRYKTAIAKRLTELGHDVKDFGTDSEAPVDYPDFIRPAAEAVAAGKCERGIVLGGSGNGEQIAANKVPGARCALGWSPETASLARRHNNALLIGIGGRMHTVAEALAIVDAFVLTPWSDEPRHQRRVDIIADYEQTGVAPPVADAQA